MNEFDKKLDLYFLILELEDWLGIKHNPQILKEVWDTMNDYYCNLEQMRYDIVYSELEDETPSIVDSEDIDEVEMERQIEESYKNLEDIRKKEAEESRLNEALPKSDFDYDFDDEINDYFKDRKPKKTNGNRISMIIKDENTIIEEKSKVIQSEEGIFGIYDVHYFQKGGFFIYKEFFMLFHKEFLIDDIKSITFDKSKDQIKVVFRNLQKLKPDSYYTFDEMIFYEGDSNLYIDISEGGGVYDKIECKYNGVGCGLDHLFEGFCSLADLEEGCAILMVNGNAYANQNLSYYYDESGTHKFRQLSETLVFRL